MRILYSSLFFVLFFSNCKKEITGDHTNPAPPAMEYTDLNNKEIGYNETHRIDLNKDGTMDFSFGTYHIGDPVFKLDKIQYVILSSIQSLLLVNEQDSSLILKKDALIPVKNSPGYNWYELSVLVFAQKVIKENGDTFWQGQWNNTMRQYLPLQVKKKDLRYNGWIEMSMDTYREKIILHRAAISKEAEKDVKAGD